MANYETITAPTMAEAIHEIKRRVGSDAVIVTTRNIVLKRWLGFRRQAMVEVVVGRGLPKPAPAARPPAKPPAPSREPARRPGEDLINQPAVTGILLKKILDETESLKRDITRLSGEVRQQGVPNVPTELAEHYTKLVQAEVSSELAVNILRSIERAGPDRLGDAEWVRARMIEHIERLIPVAGPIERKKAIGPHVVMLVGPTGVGKTTTIAKLAANLAIHQRRKVGLVTIDTYRIAAIDQLRKYADLMRVPVEVAGTPEEIGPAISRLKDRDFVLIDTAGRSPNDALKLGELGSYVEHARPDEIHLVMASNVSASCAALAVEKFSALRIDKIIFTKMDEAAQLGVVLQTIGKLNRGLSYITTGQDVPDDIESGSARDLARRIITGGSAFV
jgi:flagellar biosynthesis protein FlhF